MGVIAEKDFISWIKKVQSISQNLRNECQTLRDSNIANVLDKVENQHIKDSSIDEEYIEIGYVDDEYEEIKYKKFYKLIKNFIREEMANELIKDDSRIYDCLNCSTKNFMEKYGLYDKLFILETNFENELITKYDWTPTIGAELGELQTQICNEYKKRIIEKSKELYPDEY